MSLTVRNILIVAALAFLSVIGFYRLSLSIADAQPGPSLDAGPVTSDIAVKPPESVRPSATIDDPTVAPGAAWDDVKAARKVGWAATGLVAVRMLLFVVAWLGSKKQWKLTEPLRRNKVAWLVAAVPVVVAAAYDALMLGGSILAALTAAGAAAFAVLDPNKVQGEK